MLDSSEPARSVLRIPVAGPAPNNTLVYVRAQFPPHNRPITGRRDPYVLTTVTLYQIAGFDPARLPAYRANTRISVTGWLNDVRSVGPQEVGFAIDEVRGEVTDDGHVSVTASLESQADESEIEYDFWLSAYILVQEPQPDFSRRPLDQSGFFTQTIPERNPRDLRSLFGGKG